MTTSRREFLKAAGAAAAGVVASPAIARAQAKKGVPKEPVKVGVIAIRAGIAAPVGMAGLRGTAWWADRVNKAGGILGRAKRTRRDGAVSGARARAGAATAFGWIGRSPDCDGA